jgi:RAD51-like protein 2
MHPTTLGEICAGKTSESIHHVAVNGLADLFTFLNQLPAYLASSPSVSGSRGNLLQSLTCLSKISLIVLASLSIPFQHTPNHSTKLRLLTQLKSTLMRIGARNGVSYIVTMPLSTKLQNQDGTSANFDTGAKAVMVPALGELT